MKERSYSHPRSPPRNAHSSTNPSAREGPRSSKPPHPLLYLQPLLSPFVLCHIYIHTLSPIGTNSCPPLALAKEDLLCTYLPRKWLAEEDTVHKRHLPEVGTSGAHPHSPECTSPVTCSTAPDLGKDTRHKHTPSQEHSPHPERTMCHSPRHTTWSPPDIPQSTSGSRTPSGFASPPSVLPQGSAPRVTALPICVKSPHSLRCTSRALHHMPTCTTSAAHKLHQATFSKRGEPAADRGPGDMTQPPHEVRDLKWLRHAQNHEFDRV